MTLCLPSTGIVDMCSLLARSCFFCFFFFFSCFFLFLIKIKNYDIFRGGLFKFLINRN